MKKLSVILSLTMLSLFVTNCSKKEGVSPQNANNNKTVVSNDQAIEYDEAVEEIIAFDNLVKNYDPANASNQKNGGYKLEHAIWLMKLFS